MKLHIASRIAIFALLELAGKSDRQLSVTEIGKKYQLSSHHLAKVMNVLGRAGLVRAVRGAGGGYQFSGNTRRITLLDVIQLFEDLGAGDAQRQVELVAHPSGELDRVPTGEDLELVRVLAAHACAPW